MELGAGEGAREFAGEYAGESVLGWLYVVGGFGIGFGRL